MPIFNGNVLPASQGTTVSTSAVQVYNNSSYGGATFPTSTTLSNLTVMNTGTATCFVGTSTVSATTGVPLAPGQQLVIIGNQTAGTSGNTSWNLSAITSAGTTTTEASLATLVSVA
jgi:hypothetical protein